MLLSPNQARKLADALLTGGDDDGTGGGLGGLLDGPPQGGGPIERRFGRYHVIRLVGHGGMGEVYEARQDHPSRRVALKVVRPDFVSPELARRINHEARMLARLQHPGIAQIFDAGEFDTPRGPTPYFAMEFVEGRPLTVYVKDQRLSLRDRLDLFLAVCDAVEHAHRKGVIHRDLKPGNILVDAEGKPRVLDFGVARATDADVRATTVHTEIGKLVGTLPYMSPEQLSGDPDATDTRSDVYALGVVLYELLAGKPPYDIGRGPIAEAARIIRDTDPTPLSSVDRVFRGDLETIAGKSLEKDKERRYQSVGALAADVRRYLGNEPIEARPASAWYQVRKFATRNRVIVTAGVALLATLVGATTVSVAFALRAAKSARDAYAATLDAQGHQRTAEEQQARAERQAALSGAVVEFLRLMLTSPTPGAEGKDVRVVDVLRGAAGSIDDEFANEPAVAVMLRTTIAQTLASLGLLEEAEQQSRLAIERAERAFGPGAAESNVPWGTLGWVLYQRGKHDEAAQILSRTARLDRGHGKERETIASINNLALALQSKGRLTEALELLVSTIPFAKEKLGENDFGTLHVMHAEATVLKDLGRYEEARLRLAIVLERSTVGFGPENPITLATIETIATIHIQLGELEAGAAMLRDLLQTDRRVLGNNHPSTLTVMNNFADALRKLGRLDEAEPLFRDNLALKLDALGEEHRSTLSTMNNLSLLLQDRGSLDEALALGERTLELRRKVLGSDNHQTLTSVHNLALILRDKGDWEGAERLLDEASQGRERVLGPTHPLTLSARLNLSRIYRRSARLEHCERNLRDIIERTPAGDPAYESVTVPAHLELALCLSDQGRFNEAETYLGIVWRAWGSTPRQDRVRKAIESFASLYDAWGKPDKAAEWRAKLPPDEPKPDQPAPQK